MYPIIAPPPQTRLTIEQRRRLAALRFGPAGRRQRRRVRRALQAALRVALVLGAVPLAIAIAAAVYKF